MTRYEKKLPTGTGLAPHIAWLQYSRQNQSPWLPHSPLRLTRLGKDKNLYCAKMPYSLIIYLGAIREQKPYVT